MMQLPILKSGNVSGCKPYMNITSSLTKLICQTVTDCALKRASIIQQAPVTHHVAGVDGIIGLHQMLTIGDILTA